MRIVHAMESRLDGPTIRTANRNISTMFLTSFENIMKKKYMCNSILCCKRHGEKRYECVFVVMFTDKLFNVQKSLKGYIRILVNVLVNYRSTKRCMYIVYNI